LVKEIGEGYKQHLDYLIYYEDEKIGYYLEWIRKEIS